MGDMADDLERKCEDAGERYEGLKDLSDEELLVMLGEELYESNDNAGIELYKLRFKNSWTSAERERIIDYLTEENKF